MNHSEEWWDQALRFEQHWRKTHIKRIQQLQNQTTNQTIIDTLQTAIDAINNTP